MSNIKTSGMKPIHKAMAEYMNKFPQLSTWEVWEDFIMMGAVAFANSVPNKWWDKREERYLQIAKKYTAEQMKVFSEMLGLVMQEIRSNPEQDCLGEMFMALGLNNHYSGQFFSPYHLCSLMAKLELGETLKPTIEEKGVCTILDPTCGAGALLIAAANECRAQGVDYHKHALFVGQDIDYLVAMQCYIQLSCLGCPGYVKVGDSLSDPAVGEDGNCLLPAEDENIWETPVFQSPYWVSIRQAAKAVENAS